MLLLKKLAALLCKVEVSGYSSFASELQARHSVPDQHNAGSTKGAHVALCLLSPVGFVLAVVAAQHCRPLPLSLWKHPLDSCTL